MAERIYYLLEKYFQNACTKEEKEELASWIDLSQHDEKLKRFLEEIWNDHKPVAKMTPERADLMLSAILQKEPVNVQQPAPVIRKISFLRIAVAASVILILGAAGYLLLSNKTHREIAKTENNQKAIKNDVAPGGNKATLTLGNGSKIILDSAGNGTLASQGNTKILKLANGQLAYDASKDPSINEVPTEIVSNTLTTPAGGQYQLVLPDGTKVWLDASSSITYPTAFAGTQRKVEITGQAYFEVAKNERLPFVVQSGEMSVQVLGTHFNVNAYKDESEVSTTLLEGSVKIVQGASRTVISPGQQMRISKNGEFKLIKNADIEEAIAWKNGFFRFNRSDLKTVMRQLSRWYDVEVVYQGNIPAQQFGGKMERDLNLSEILEGLEKSMIHFKIEGKKLIVMP